MIYQAEQRLHEAKMSPMPLPGATSIMAPTETPSHSMPTTTVAASVTYNQLKSAAVEVTFEEKPTKLVVDNTRDDLLTIKDNQKSSNKWSPPSSSSSSSSPVSSSATTAKCDSSDIKIETECENVVVKTEDGDSTSVPKSATTVADNGSSSNSSLPVPDVASASKVEDDVIKKEEEEEEEENDGDSFGKSRRALLSAVNAHIICNLCHGYLIDATTIVECLHSFCHSCIMQHLRIEQYCPRCEMMINTAKPNIKPDTTLQAIVYKLVPGLYEKELKRKRAFYKNRPEDAALTTPEQRGEDTEHLIFSPKEYMSLSLEYADIDEHVSPEDELMAHLLKPKYLQCPAIFTVGHLKKFVFGKFDIDTSLFSVDIMYKVKTIVLLDHYTIMDVAYIYTWKRDAPMRFYFRVKERPKRALAKHLPKVIPKEESIEENHLILDLPPPQCMTVIHNEPEPSPSQGDLLKIVSEMKSEHQDNAEKVVPPITAPPISSAVESESQKTNKLKITLVSKPSKQSKSLPSPSSETPGKSNSKSHRQKETLSADKDERKVENIKLKIDLSKQNSVTIINMSDPDRKEIVKQVKPEKEWKVKNKKEKNSSGISKTLRDFRKVYPLTVPPLTIKAERINPPSPKSIKPPSPLVRIEDPQSQFLKSFALTPKKDVQSPITQEKKLEPLTLTLAPVLQSQSPVPPAPTTPLMGPPLNLPSKRKSKDPIKSAPKKSKCIFAPTLTPEDFKIKLPLVQPEPKKDANFTAMEKQEDVKRKKESERVDGKLMPPPTPVTLTAPIVKSPPKLAQPRSSAPPKNGMKSPSDPVKSKKLPVKFAPPGSLTPHPMHAPQKAAPGNRTPVSKRFQPILPKGGRPNPFANIPNDVNKILQDAGTEIKSISSTDGPKKKIYGPKVAPAMGPPPTSAGNKTPTLTPTTVASGGKNGSISNYLNFALFNASKSRGNEVPPGCRTPMYTPNSPIYSPSSPQYVPNYNIPTQPTYKYTPKPSSSSNYLQSVLAGTNNQLSSLFPAPPTKKPENGFNNRASPPAQMPPSPQKTDEKQSILEMQLKRPYPYAKSPSPIIEDPPEKQLKVKSLLNSCNINIPSSLSITITSEDSETPLNNASYPKHKSPVNNYIEILKLPDQSAVESENKRMSQSLNQNQPQQKQNQNQNQNQNLQVLTSVSIHSIMTPKSSQAVRSTMSTNTTTTAAVAMQPSSKQIPPLNPIDRKHKAGSTPSHSPGDGKKTPSPDKRSPGTAANSAEKRQGSEPNSPKSSTDAPASKKFRHILPRTTPDLQNGTPSHSSVVQKPAPKKPGPKKSSAPTQAGGSQANVNASKKSTSTSSGVKLSPPTASPVSFNNNTVTNKSKKSSAKQPPPQTQALPLMSLKKQQQISSGLIPTMTPPVIPPPPPASQADLNKFLSEHIFRPKAQAGINQCGPNLAPNLAAPNLFYPFQSPQYTSVYSCPQSYIMEHFSRMRRAGSEALEQYMQKLKGVETKAGELPMVIDGRKSPMSTKSAVSAVPSLTADSKAASTK